MFIQFGEFGDDYTQGVDYDCDTSTCHGLNPGSTEVFSLLQEQLNRAGSVIGAGSISVDGIIGDRTLGLARQVFGYGYAPMDLVNLLGSNDSIAGVAANAVAFMSGAQAVADAAGIADASPVPSSSGSYSPNIPRATTSGIVGDASKSSIAIWSLMLAGVVAAGGIAFAITGRHEDKPRGRARTYRTSRARARRRTRTQSRGRR